MKKQVFLFMAVLLAVMQSAFAYDFSAVAPSGQTLYYNIVNGKAQVVRPGIGFSYNDYVSGELVIPATVTYNGTTYIVTSIGESAFSGCSSLTSVTIPNNVISIGEYAFDYCMDLTSVSIPPSVATINYSAFRGCSGITSVVIPSSVTSIGDNAFYDVRHIEYHGNATGSPWGAISMNGVVDGDFVYSDATGQNLTAYIGTGGAVTIPNTVVTIGAKAFYDFDNLTSVTFPNSVTSIGNNAFYGCGGLTSVTIPNSVTSIGNEAFRYCTGLTSAIIGDGVTIIRDYTFAYCSSLTTVTIGRGVTSIGSQAFNGSGLTSVIFNAENCSSAGNAFSSIYCSNIETFTIGNDVKNIPSGLCYNCNGLRTVVFNAERCISAGSGTGNSIYSAFRGCNNLTNITFGNNVKRIPSYLCYGCGGLTSIAIPDSVTEIGDYAFCGCGSLSSISVPNRVSSIGWYAFCNCTGLTSVTIPNSVTSIGNFAFSGCSGLTSITIPNNIYSIGNSVFSGCSSLNSVIIHSRIASIGERAFYNCSGLTSVTILGGVMTIGDYAFAGCSGLSSVTIPNSVTSIGSYTFYNCSGLASVTIGKNVTSIGSGAFYGCNHLLTVRCRAVYPPTAGNNSFYNVPEYSTLIVPCGSIQYYSVTSAWNSAFNIIQEDCRGEFTVTVVSANPTMGRAIVDGASTAAVLDGDEAILVADAFDGYRFVRWNDNNTNAVRTITVTANVTYTAYFESNPFGIADVDVTQIKVYATEGRIMVLGAEGMDVGVYDMMGRRVAYSATAEEHDIPMPTAGVYLVKVGTLPAHKVAVIR